MAAQHVNRSDGTLRSTSGDKLYHQRWTPAESPRAVILLAHGLAEHSGRYAGFARFFTAAGFAVYTLDFPGHGRSDGLRCHIRRFEDLTGSLDALLRHAKDENSGVPLILVGHSMGGLISAAFLPEHQSEFAAAVLSGPAIKAPQQPSTFALIIIKIIAALFPRLGVMQLDAKGVSRDPQIVSDYENDPLVFRGKVSARLASEVFQAMDRVLADAAKISLPMLMLHGGSDSLTSVEGSEAMNERISSDDKKLIVYDGLYHEIFNEPERHQVMSDMKDWLEARLPA